MIQASGRGMQAHIPPGWISLWMPLSGAIEFGTMEDSWTLAPGRLMLAREWRLRGYSRTPSWWLALCGPIDAWSRHLRSANGTGSVELFPSEIACTREIRRLLVRLARQSDEPEHKDTETHVLVDTLCATLVDTQSDLHQRLNRCSGRTLQRRKLTLLRLLRVKLMIDHHEDGKPDLQQLSRISGYSPCHLIRAFRDVFDETPFEYAGKLRLARALRMVRDTGMPICEITEALGFESQSAFCRAFKSAFGMTATELRRDATYPAMREIARAA